MTDESVFSARPLTEKEREILRALNGCRLADSWDNQFVRDMSGKTTASDKQAFQLQRLVWRYRRQMPPHLRPAARPEPASTRRPNELARVV